MFDKGLVLFSGKDCAACKALKEKLTKDNVEFVEYDIWNNPEALKYIMSKGYRTIPQLFKDGVKQDG